VRRFATAVLAVAALGAAAPSAQAAKFLGRPWPGGRVPYAVTSATLRTQVHIAVRAWNRSGVDIRFVEVPRSRARLLISGLHRGRCLGVIGETDPGYRRGRVSRLRMQPGCPVGIRVTTAAHELGHVLGLGHENRGCTLMNANYLAHCHPQPLDWEWYCSPARPDDLRGLIRLYGGRFRAPGSRLCVASSLPGPVQRLGDAADPVDSLARVRLSFLTPVSPTLRRVIVTRRAGRQCGDTPLSRVVPIVHRLNAPARLGTLVTELRNPAHGAVVAVEDLRVAGPGTWCYAVFTLDRSHRWRLAGTRLVRRGRESPLAGRIALAATAAAPTGVRLTWINPTTPVASVQVVRASGSCAGATGRLVPIAAAPTRRGAVAFVDASAPAGTWCYGVRFRTVAPSARQLLATVQLVRP
jgi:hypothetical protein